MGIQNREKRITNTKKMKLFALLSGAASAENLLYCIYAGGHTNPNALPNNMCCPFIEQPGIRGKPYHAAIHGCCGTQLYDLNTQDCCVDSGTVIEQGFNSLTVDPPASYTSGLIVWRLSHGMPLVLVTVTKLKSSV